MPEQQTPVLHMLASQLMLTTSTLLLNFYTANSAVLLPKQKSDNGNIELRDLGKKRITNCAFRFG